MMQPHGSKVVVWKEHAEGVPVSVKKFIAVPEIYPRQAQFIHTREANGVDVFIVSASPEELLRFLTRSAACAPGFNLDLPPERVIGVNTLLRNHTRGEITLSRQRPRKSGALLDAECTRAQLDHLRFASFVLTPGPALTGLFLLAFRTPRRMQAGAGPMDIGCSLI